MSRPLALIAALLLLLPAPAGAIDCSKAESSAEKLICANPALTQLDAVLNKDYPAYAARQGKDAAKRSQADWLKQRDACADAACLETVYTRRIREITGAEKFFIFRGAAPEWDALVSVLSCGEDRFSGCQGPATVDIFAKDSGESLQRIRMPQMFVELDAKGETTVNKVQIYGEHNSCLVADDFNFDGHTDLALRNGNEGAYGGPSYDVYLYAPGKKRFVRNQALTALASENLGLFDVDPKDNTLSTFNKSGCCWHIYSTYQIKNNAPVLVREVTEDATSFGKDDETREVVITDKKLVNGKWRTTVTRAPIEE